MSDNALSTQTSGRLIKKFNFHDYSSARLFEIPILIVFPGSVLIFMIVGSIIQPLVILSPHPEQIVHILKPILGDGLGVSVIIAIVIALLITLPEWIAFLQGQYLHLYENGILWRDWFYLWDEIDAIATIRGVHETACQIYVDGVIIFNVAAKQDIFSNFINLFQQKCSDSLYKRLRDQYKTTTQVRFGNVQINATGIQQNNYEIALQDIDRISSPLNKTSLIIAHKNGINEMVVMLEGLPNGHLLKRFLQEIVIK